MKIFTVASILFGAGLQIHEGYADANFTSFQIKEIEKLSRAEFKNVKEFLKTPTRQITQSPCPDSVVLNDNNANDKLTDNSVNKEVIRCFDTSKVTNMDRLFNETVINADLSSWDVASVTNMDVSCQSLQYQLKYIFN